MKRILFLGGAPTQVPPIQYALDQGHYVITCDYLPENPGHKLAHEYYNVSTTDKEAVLELAKRLNIDGIVAYASDPAAPAAAYVAEFLGLSGNPYDSVMILTKKDLFRGFQQQNGFFAPKSIACSNYSELFESLSVMKFPVFIKPVDSSGSKGVRKLESAEQLENAFYSALEFSREKVVVVEEAVTRTGYQIDSDCFVVDGDLKICFWGDQYQDKLCSEVVPIGIGFPSVIDKDVSLKARKEIENIFRLLDIKSGAFNVEFFVTDNDDVFIIEIGPRNGGNLIPEVMKYVIGADMIAATVDNALGIKPDFCNYREQASGYYSSYLIHALDNGIYKGMYVSEKVKSKIIENDLWVSPGDKVYRFNGSHHTLGTMVLKFDSMEEMQGMMNNMENDIRVICS